MLIVNYDHIVKNLEYLKNKYHKDNFLIIKNNAYNTGLEETINHCTQAGLNHFALTSLKEGIKAARANKNAYILIMNPLNKEEIKQAKEYKNIALSITSKEWYDLYKEDLKNIKLHLKVNIGMNRFGLSDIDDINDILSSNRNIEGLFTHFPVSDIDDLTIHNKQVDSFVKIYNKIINKEQLKYIHSQNSATLLLDDNRLSFCNFGRIGILGYGYSPTTFDSNLKPSIYLNAKVVAINKIKENEYIGYGLSNKMDKDKLIAICNIGYGDGLNKLRVHLPVYIKNKEYKVLAVSMSHLIVEVDHNIKIDDIVEIYGDHIRIDHLLNYCDTSCSIHMSSLHHQKNND
ncbi:MAG: alanine racemase [Erysipelotrichales bacterium]